ncbi:MAG: hypothetical protein IKA99_07900 [Clostridia bacterium]|nr:hypothetical protein [Clostridia bacterium]
MLLKENNYDFKVQLLEIHKKDIRDYSKKPLPTEYVIEEGIRIVMGKNPDEVVKTAAYDFCDYLMTSLGVSSMVTKEAGKGQNIILGLSNNLTIGNGYMGYRISFDENINIEGHDVRGVAQALYYLEDLMNVRKAPFLTKETIERKALFSPRITQSPFGMYEYPDEAFAIMAHGGFDAIDLWIKDAWTDLRGEYLDIRFIYERAKKYGIDVYVELYAPHSAHPDDEGSQEFYDKLYGELFSVCPGIRGITLIGEATNFASRDPNVGKVPYSENFIENIPTGKISPGWYPCRDYPAWVNMIKNSVRKYNKDAEIIFCTYNWGFTEEKERVRLINDLPTDITVMAAWDMFHKMKRENTVQAVCDYTLSFPGPGEYFMSEATAAKKRGIKVCAISNTSGRTWDFGVVPYEPMPEQWIKRYKNIVKANDEYGLKGLVENIHYGFHPSIISDLEKQACFTEVKPLEEVLKDILIREFGETNAPIVKRATEYFSEAICHYPPTNEDQYGAYRIGPSYPLWSGVLEGLPSTIPDQGKIPPRAHAMFGNLIYFGVYTPDSCANNSLPGVRIYDEIVSTEKMIELFNKGIEVLEQAKDGNTAFYKFINLAKFIRNSCKTVLAVKKHYILKQELSIAGTPEKAEECIKGIEDIILAERENVLDTIPIVQQDSRIGWEPSMDYTTDEHALQWKLRQLDYELTIKLPTYRKANTLKAD